MPATVVAGEGPRFLVFGDAPYTEEQIKILKDTIAPAIQDAGFSFLIHLGDMKGGGESCTDELIRARYLQLMSFLPERVFFTPGDNDWTDCDRPKLKERFPEVGRLAFLRDLIKSKPLKLPSDWHYATQKDFPENARWTRGNVMFATIHIVGTNNGREEILENDIETTLDLVDARDQANRVWLRAAFDAAHEFNSGAVVIAIQADVTAPAGAGPCGASVRVQCDAFAAFRDELLRHAASFQEPVLLIHGDTSPFCLDKKFGGDTAPALWRLNALGDYSEVDATALSVQLGDSDEPFEIAPMMTGASVGRTCP